MDLYSKVILNNGIKMPYFGLGVYQTKGPTAVSLFRWAIKHGYRSFDTAAMYGNEQEIGEAIRTSSIPRKELFVTTKLWNTDHGYQNALNAFEKSLNKMELDYIDLYLIHWPVIDKRLDSWNALESLVETESVRAIGVSNYMVHHLEELLSQCEIIPAVNQVEFHPYLFREDLLGFCQNQNIQLEAYSPLTKGRKLNDPLLKKIANKYSKSPAQLLIRWCLQHNVVVIPKSSNKNRIIENTKVFDFQISQEDMRTLNSLDKRYISSWDPSDEP